jgi:S1-C subfamily serine protease
MSYDVAREISSNYTYGWRLATVIAGGPSDGKLQVDDIIIALNGNLIRNNDDLASYLEEHTLPNQSLTVTVARGNQQVQVTLTLGVRPAPT